MTNKKRLAHGVLSSLMDTSAEWNPFFDEA